MANRYHAEIKVGGEITAEQHEKIVELMEDATRNGEVTDEGNVLSVWDNDVWDGTGRGEFPELMDYLREHGIPFNRIAEDPEQGGHYITATRAGIEDAQEDCDEDGELSPKMKSVREEAKKRGVGAEEVMADIAAKFALPTLIVDGRASGKFSFHFDHGGDHIVTYEVEDNVVTGCAERGYSMGEKMATAQGHWRDQNGVKVTNPVLLQELDRFWHQDADDEEPA